MNNILIVDDDVKLNYLMSSILIKKGYKTFQAVNGYEALEVMDNNYIDLIISDIMMPKMNGYEFIKEVRELNKNVPILFVSAKDSFEAKAKSFDMGIDDYMVKPIDINEMCLRVEALLRRAKIANERKLIIGGSTLDYDSLTVKNDTEVTLPQKEFNILFKLLSYPGRIFTRSQLMDEFWGLSTESLERTVDVHITRIRDKFKDNEDFEIVTVRGLGYKAVIK